MKLYFRKFRPKCSKIQDKKIGNKKLNNFYKTFLCEVVYAFSFGGFQFVGVLFEFFCDKKFSMGAPLNFLPKLLPGKTLCKFCQIFPPKDLVYIGRKNFVTPLIS